MSKEGPYIPFYPSDWLAGTRGMTASETGVYITLIAMMYERAEPLSFDHKKLARLCGTTPATFQKILTSLIEDGKINETSAGLWNNRVEKECRKRCEKSGQASEAASVRWKKDKQNQREPDAGAPDPQCARNANQKPEPEPESISPSGEIVPVPADDVADAVGFFNATAERVGWSKIQKVGQERRTHLKARMKEAGGIDGWKAAIERAAASSFLTGQTDKPFMASFDFLVSKQKFTRLMEGNYDDRGRQAPGQTSERFDATLEQIARVARSR